MIKIEHQATALFICIVILIASTFVSFWPGTSGGFLVDDFYNLQPLGDDDGIVDFTSLRQFVFSGGSGPTGRPLSLLSFALNTQTWPTDPLPLKITNLLLHSINAILIFAIFFKIFRLNNQQKEKNYQPALIISFFISLVWAIHPLHASTVLYIVQRMVELSTLFVLLGLWCYLYGRERLQDNPGPAYLWMSAGVIIFGFLATLSKENGALLPLFVITLELTLLSNIKRPDHWRYWAFPILGIPTLCLFLYLSYVVFNHAHFYAFREFTLYERLLSETRIIFDYLGKIILPLDTPTLNYDQNSIAKTELYSIFTYIAVTAIIGLIISAFYFQKKHIVISFAILWFFTAHLLESTVLPLELYFEHRNYLAMLGPIVALVYYAEKLFMNYRIAISTVIAIILISEISLTLTHSYTWGDSTRLTATWAQEQPDTIRAQSMYAIQLYSNGETQEALELLEESFTKNPDNLGLRMLYTEVTCSNNTLTDNDIQNLILNLKRLTPDLSVTFSINRIARNVIAGKCTQITNEQIEEMIKSLLDNKNISKLQDASIANLYVLLSDVYIALNDAPNALYAIDESLKLRPHVDLALKQAYILAMINKFQPAMTQLNKAVAFDKMRKPLLPSQEPRIEKMRKFIETRRKTINGT